MGDSQLSCPICTDSYEDANNICSTVCGHIFHFTCILQWQEQSNTCPMCNRTNPAPHRIFIDINAVSVSTVENSDDNKVVIKGIPPNQITTPLKSVVMKLVGIMRISIRESDIEVSKVGNTLQVSFNSLQHKRTFIGNKFKLKGNPQTSSIVIHELVNAETKALFQYAHKLKPFGYTIFFIHNKKVYVKKKKNSEEINILSKEQVDSLCRQVANITQPLPEPSVPRRRNIVENNIRRQPREDTDMDEDLVTQAIIQYIDVLDNYDMHLREFDTTLPREAHQPTPCLGRLKALFKKLCSKFKKIAS